MMPDINRYTSVSISKKAYKDLTLVQEAMSKEFGATLSLAKLIEHLVSDKSKTLKLNGHSK